MTSRRASATHVPKERSGERSPFYHNALLPVGSPCLEACGVGKGGGAGGRAR